MDSDMNIDPPVGEESLERPEKRRKIEETTDDGEVAPGTLGGLETVNALEVERHYDSGGEEDAMEPPKDVSAGTDSKPTELQDRSGLQWDDEGYPILTEFWAGVKKEFLLTKTQLLALQNQTSSTGTKGGQQDKKLSKRQERKQRIQKSEIENANKLCPIAADGRDCPYPEKCKFQHNVGEWLTHQDPLPFPDHKCPIFEKRGHCNFGWACRVRGHHTKIETDPVTGVQKYLNIVLPEVQAAFKKDTSNMLPHDTAMLLRKKKHPWPRADVKVKEVLQVLKTKRDSSAIAPDYEKLPPREWKKQVDFRGKLILAPLTTVGNLPFRRICKSFGADITIGEMALCSNLLQGKASEWALTRRHECEDVFGIQIAGNFADMTARTVELLNHYTDADFIDLNSGCPIDMLYNNGMGCGLMNRPQRMAEAVCAMTSTSTVPVTLKIRAGRDWSAPVAHSEVVPNVERWGLAALTIHGRTKNQHYKTEAHWDYIQQCAKLTNIPVIGNGDIYDFEDAVNRLETSGVSSLMLARGAIIKPWLFTEIKERRRWDISSKERFELLQKYANWGMEHWGSDTQGLDRVRFFLLNWLSFLHRYVPVGILERFPIKINQRPPTFVGRDDLETLMASPKIDDWVKLAEMVLGPAPKTFTFEVKHQANAYNTTNG